MQIFHDFDLWSNRSPLKYLAVKIWNIIFTWWYFLRIKVTPLGYLTIKSMTKTLALFLKVLPTNLFLRTAPYSYSGKMHVVVPLFELRKITIRHIISAIRSTTIKFLTKIPNLCRKNPSILNSHFISGIEKLTIAPQIFYLFSYTWYLPEVH